MPKAQHDLTSTLLRQHHAVGSEVLDQLPDNETARKLLLMLVVGLIVSKCYQRTTVTNPCHQRRVSSKWPSLSAASI